MKIQEFQNLVWDFAAQHTRAMPWRTKVEPYYVLVSEVMLQQTQVERVVPKFEAFVVRFPTVQSLANAPLSDVLVAWNGLGYNRRAKFLWLAAQKITTNFAGQVPRTQPELVGLPGVGPNTAGAILAYSFNQPVVFIETNIRSVYLHHFFNDAEKVSDKQILELIQQTLSREHPREWYWALMDYGAHLKRQGNGRLAQSAHHKKQAPLKGSLREMRGRIIKTLSASPLGEQELKLAVAADDRFEPALQALLKEQLIKKHRHKLSLA